MQAEKSHDQSTQRYSTQLAHKIEVSDEFRALHEPLSKSEQDGVGRVVGLLEERVPGLPYPYSSGIQGSALSHQRELRIQHAGPTGCFTPFDPQNGEELSCLPNDFFLG